MVYVLGVLLPENQLTRVSAPLFYSSLVMNKQTGFSSR